MDAMEKQYLELVACNDAWLRRLSRVCSEDAVGAEVLHQEMLLQLWRALPAFRGAASVDTWVYRVALN